MEASAHASGYPEKSPCKTVRFLLASVRISKVLVKPLRSVLPFYDLTDSEFFSEELNRTNEVRELIGSLSARQWVFKKWKLVRMPAGIQKKRDVKKLKCNEFDDDSHYLD